MLQPDPPPPPTSPPDQQGPGPLIPRHVIVAGVCFAVGAVTGLLVWLAPVIWLPVGASMTVTGLSLTVYQLWHGRHPN
ncbi:hypothetical protein GCM10009727_83410 [Actinomadura napierensis]|uniref:DUF2530 domain-containing protein n=1 Tax=Actinomadura napierensis TaxID=267854 RepID=A0ABN3AFU5_9ACTN